MGGSWIVIGASLLGLVSILLIAGSLWANSSGRKRARTRPLVSGSYAPVPSVNQAPIGPSFFSGVATTEHTMITSAPMAGQTVITAAPGVFGMASEEPQVDQATQFLTVDDIFALADDRVEPTRILDPDELLVAQPVEPVQPVARAPVIVAARPSVAASPMPVASMSAASIPAASIPRSPSKPVASKPAPAPANEFAPPNPSEFAKPAVDVQPTPYVGYVAPRGPGHDDDDDDDDDDPETELVHQAELMRLMMKSRPPG